MRDIEREHGRRPVPAIALTGFASAAERQLVLSAGYQHHVVKPIDPFELVDMLAKAISLTSLD